MSRPHGRPWDQCYRHGCERPVVGTRSVRVALADERDHPACIRHCDDAEDYDDLIEVADVVDAVADARAILDELSGLGERGPTDALEPADRAEIARVLERLAQHTQVLASAAAGRVAP